MKSKFNKIVSKIKYINAILDQINLKILFLFSECVEILFFAMLIFIANGIIWTIGHVIYELMISWKVYMQYLHYKQCFEEWWYHTKQCLKHFLSGRWDQPKQCPKQFFYETCGKTKEWLKQFFYETCDKTKEWLKLAFYEAWDNPKEWLKQVFYELWDDIKEWLKSWKRWK